MKNPSYQRRLGAMRLYHANRCDGRFDAGVRAFHRYDEFADGELSWWDDCQIIVGGRRVMIWWTHPRFKYRNAIEDAAWKAVGDPPEHDWLNDMRSRPIRKPAGKSRKRIVAYEHGEPGVDYQAWSGRLRAEEDRLAAEGLDLSVRPVFSRCTLDWCTGLELCIPVEVRNLGELKVLAEIGRRLIKNETTLEVLFPGYVYGRKEWLAERPQRDALGPFSAQVLSLPVAG